MIPSTLKQIQPLPTSSLELVQSGRELRELPAISQPGSLPESPQGYPVRRRQRRTTGDRWNLPTEHVPVIYNWLIDHLHSGRDSAAAFRGRYGEQGARTVCMHTPVRVRARLQPTAGKPPARPWTRYSRDVRRASVEEGGCSRTRAKQLGQTREGRNEPERGCLAYFPARCRWKREKGGEQAGYLRALREACCPEAEPAPPLEPSCSLTPAPRVRRRSRNRSGCRY